MRQQLVQAGPHLQQPGTEKVSAGSSGQERPFLLPLRALLAHDGVGGFSQVHLPVCHRDFLVRRERVPGMQTRLKRRARGLPSRGVRGEAGSLLDSAGLTHQQSFAQVPTGLLRNLPGQLGGQEQTLFFADGRQNATHLSDSQAEPMR